MTDKCQYPSCREPIASFMHRGGKVVGLCDHHLDHLLSENRKLVMQVEKAVKLPPIETGARTATFEEEDIYCCAPNCPKPAALFYGPKPVCHEHAPEREYLPFDGTYRKRKILVVERPKAAPNAVVMKGSGTGDEKREKKRKIYPVNPTRGIPLPAKEPIDVDDEREQRAEERGLVEEVQDMVEAETSYGKPTKTAQAKEDFVETVQESPEDDISAILARLNSGELEMPED